jgi:hypothetical protein
MCFGGNKMEINVGDDVVIIRNTNTSNYISNDDKFMGAAYNKMVKIVYKFDNGFLLTDFFQEKFMNINHENPRNNYIYYGFLVVDEENIRKVL